MMRRLLSFTCFFLLLAGRGAVMAEEAESPSAAPTMPDLTKLRVKELQALLDERGQKCAACSEKADLIARVQEVWDMPLLSAEPAPAAPGISAESAAEMRKAKDPADLEKILRDLNMQIPGGGGFKMFGKDDIEKMTREMKTEEPEEEL